jgi:predicted DNA-binding mobile mystery protein A
MIKETQMDFKRLKKNQLMDQANHTRSLSLPPVPKKGWIRFFRDLLSMTSSQLGSRIGVTQSRITELEKAELNKSTTLKSLENAANALNCDLYYAFVPREDIGLFLRKKAIKTAKERMDYVSHQMKLEDQEISIDEKNAQFEELLEDILKNPKDIWK